MGRTNPTYRDRIDALEREWGPYRRGLRATDQGGFDRLFEHAREYAHAAGYLNHPTAEFPLLVSILLAHERRHGEIEDRVETLETRVGALEGRLDAIEDHDDDSNGSDDDGGDNEGDPDDGGNGNDIDCDGAATAVHDVSEGPRDGIQD